MKILELNNISQWKPTKKQQKTMINAEIISESRASGGSWNLSTTSTAPKSRSVRGEGGGGGATGRQRETGDGQWAIDVGRKTISTGKWPKQRTNEHYYHNHDLPWLWAKKEKEPGREKERGRRKTAWETLCERNEATATATHTKHSHSPLAYR